MDFTREIQEALGGAFPEDEIEFLPRAQSGGKALGLAYIDARSVMRRLDAVVGPENWSFDFDVLSPDGKMVKGRLTVLGVTKCDAGEAAQEDEVLKSAVSDALKRCAVHFGIGRYLYYLPRVWAPYDAQKRRFLEAPRLAPAAVEEALRICGISHLNLRAGDGGSSRPAPAAQASVKPEARAPESSGDRAATEARPPQPAARPTPPVAPASATTEMGAKGGVATAQQRPAAPAAVAPAAAETSGALACSGADCGKPLTKGQHDMSVRAYGQPLCPACQKQHQRVGA